MADITNLIWSTFIPQLDDAAHLAALDRLIKETGCEIVAVDPAYLALGGTDAGNVFIQGEKLGRVSKVCECNQAGLILAHHNTKTSERQGKHKPPELDDLAWAGFAEHARQWLLVGRREAFVPGSGEHKLWLNAGGSAGHSSLWALDISEGRSGLPRHWEVTVLTPNEACEEKKSLPLRERILEAARRFPNGESKTVILDSAKIKSNVTTRNVWDSLVNEGRLVPHQIKKRGVAYPGVRVAI